MQHPLPQEVKITAPVHRSLNQFQPIYLSFGLSVAPWLLERRSDFCIVTSEAPGECFQIRNSTLLACGQPCIKGRGGSFPHHCLKLFGQHPCCGNARMLLNLREERLVIGIQGCDIPQEQPDQLPCTRQAWTIRTRSFEDRRWVAPGGGRWFGTTLLDPASDLFPDTGIAMLLDCAP